MQLPPLSQVATALRKTTEVLAQELAAPADEAPHWTEFEWHIARAVSAMQGVSSLLHGRLRWEGPDGWRRFLAAQRDHSVARHGQIKSLLNAIDSRARRDGLPLVALKGAALHASALYAAGERPMGDIDLLVRKDDTAAIAGVLEACGYAAGFDTHRHRVYQSRLKKSAISGRLGEHADNPINIEVHTRIAEQLPITGADITQFLFPGAAHAGTNAYPSAAALMLHLLLHAAGNMRARALRLIQLHDIALLAQRLDSHDWEELLAMRIDNRAPWWALAPLIMTARYFPSAIPSELFASLAKDCPAWLRNRARRQQLADVSWSNIRIEAFPGLEWSRTPREALQFVSSRIWPSREARSELAEGAAQIPGAVAIPWYGISHGARIVRWVFSRPPRVQTLLSVRAALDQCTDEPDIHTSR
jgi:Uncharacterised nucleotidyltransferase